MKVVLTANMIHLHYDKLNFPSIDILPHFRDVASGFLACIFSSNNNISTNIEITNDYYYNLLISKVELFVSSYNYSSQVWNFVPHYLDLNCAYLSWILVIFNSSQSKLILLGALSWLISLIIKTLENLLLSAMPFIERFAIGIINILANINYNIIRFYIFFLLPTLVSANNLSLSHRNIYIILSLLGNAVYILLGIPYDYYMARARLYNRFIFNNRYIAFPIMGVNYFMYIMSGVFSSNGVWFLTSNIIRDRTPFIIGTGGFAFLSYSLWYLLGVRTARYEYTIINSIFRSILEAISFNCVSFFTYAIWDLILTSNIFSSWPSILLFTPLHFLFSIIAIYYEYTMRANFLLYGLVNLCSFTCIAFSTNAIFAYLSMPSGYVLPLSITIIGGVFTSILNPTFYRFNNIISQEAIQLNNLGTNISINNSNNTTTVSRRLILISVIKYYILVLAFVSCSGFLFTFIN